ncbi:hypothetical protein F5144DRAFT_650199 [Chaetomium tenue]|uniref:Uncharacterized protein n=1 Tax=Chaetomium tenue TaxID=1854479 RepID=A0ACB7P829_9PEZI|nr:hypothetical protein F5144DRAFT_650199 [Chaetomium globosum]
MGDAVNESVIEGTASQASARVICEEFLKVLSREEVEQPMIWYPKPLPLRPILAIPALPAPALGLGHHQTGSGEKRSGEGEDKKKEKTGKEKEKKAKEKNGDKLPPIAGYAGDPDLVDVPVYFCGEGYTGEDRQALAWAAEVMHLAQLPPVEVAGGGVDEVCRLEVLRRCKPAAVIAGPCVVDSDSESGGDLGDGIKTLLVDDYEEFKLDKGRAPHTIGPSHLYIRKDIVDLAEREAIVPPYPVTFPHDYPYDNKSWYLDKLRKNGSGKVVRCEETS